LSSPPENLLTMLELRLLAELGGRLNRHWLVKAKGERKVLRRWSPQPEMSIEYERILMVRFGELGWPVACLDEPVEYDGYLWSLAPFLPGEPMAADNPVELRTRGRLLAQFHADATRIDPMAQRSGWRRCEEILFDPEADRILSENESTWPEEVRIIRWHMDRARLRIDGLNLSDRRGVPIHGDFARWNLLFDRGRLSGLIDFEAAHNDHRVADFALAWRGKYDEVIQGYEEVSPLEPEERATIVPAWWAWLIEGACRDMRNGNLDDGWTVTKLLCRTSAMGPDAKDLP